MKSKRVSIEKVAIIDLYAALQEAIREKLITEKEADAIAEYSQSGEGGSYWEMHWGDIEEENGMSTEEAMAFKKVYKKIQRIRTHP
jgi:hypothetical protein